MTFQQRVRGVCANQNSLLCVGLDPDLKQMPRIIKNEREPLFKFCSEIIASTKQAAAAFKLNFAFFEAEGSHGWAQMEKLLDHIPSNILKIADAKRADIGSSSERYAHAILTKLDFDAVTVNPYLGQDSILPFLQWPSKGAFILCLTSNPGAKDFQYFSDGTNTLFDNVISRVSQWNQAQNCGLVVGATHADQTKAIRAAAGDLPFLVPGVGAQGGDLQSAVINATNESGELALFNSSRGIIYRSVDSDFAEAAGLAAETLRNEINAIRTKKSSDIEREIDL